MLTRFNDRVFLQEGRWFLWDPTLGLFRPIDNYAWNGTKYEVDDHVYCTDPLSKTYCFGSAEMLSHCIALTKKHEDRIPDVPTASYLAIGDFTWFRDRPVSFIGCSPRDVASWKRLVNGHARTCKRRSNKRFTKRNL
jgi:hypothetical protein